MIVKVKEPQASECAMLRPGQILFTYLHLAPDPKQTDLPDFRTFLGQSKPKPNKIKGLEKLGTTLF
jgi:hypothetical protein